MLTRATHISAGFRKPLLVTIVAMAAVLLTASTVLAHHKPGHTGGPTSGVQDNRGTVKIHEGAAEPSPIMSNQPKVCNFHVHMFKLHAGQTVTISIVGHGGPNAGPDTYNATATTDTNGEAREPATGSITLADGTYKLTVDTGKGAGKHKVFKVDCPAGSGGDDGGPNPGTGSGGGPSNVVPGGSNVVPGGSNVVPGGNNVVPGGSNVVPGGNNVVPGGSSEEGPGSPTKPGVLPNTAVESKDAVLLVGAGLMVLAALGGFVFAMRKPSALAR